jgi:uncharacterized membrane-anchored protein YhcB (DUF1043 family)
MALVIQTKGGDGSVTTIVILLVLAFVSGFLIGALVMRQLNQKLIAAQARLIELLKAEIAGLERRN